MEYIKPRLDQVKVVAVTCLGITSSLLTGKKFDVCIMDEAGQITLMISLGPLMFSSTCVLVGDHYQLPSLVLTKFRSLSSSSLVHFAADILYHIQVIV
ncbi:unnamed protein product [Linum tenue]|uniref:DNA replication ATP-dependent helicase/nuclease n=1 Tax=Linum tenue TaxID=586396 RepID=A0AAV0K754_9ROSI|nr:unnamed protein product [Linum tenue]